MIPKQKQDIESVRKALAGSGIKSSAASGRRPGGTQKGVLSSDSKAALAGSEQYVSDKRITKD